jgi:outer membrane biosynthesis protein TonB
VSAVSPPKRGPAPAPVDEGRISKATAPLVLVGVLLLVASGAWAIFARRPATAADEPAPPAPSQVQAIIEQTEPEPPAPVDHPPQPPPAPPRPESKPPPPKKKAAPPPEPKPEHLAWESLPSTPAPAVARKPLSGLVNPTESGDVTLRNDTQLAWTQCDLRIPPNRVYRFPVGFALAPAATTQIPAAFWRVDARPPDPQLALGAWARARCAEGVAYLPYDRKQ